MNKILFIVPYPKGEAPSQRFRFEQYEEILIERGFSVDYAPFFDERTWKILYLEGYFFKKGLLILSSFFRRFLLLFRIRQYDFLFIHREMSPLGPPIFELILARILRRHFVYDFDDAIWLPNYSKANSKFEKLKMYQKVNRIMSWASKISAGNDYLADYAKRYCKDVCVLPTTIDTENYHNVLCNQDTEIVTIGWTGSHSTMHYLDEIIPVLHKLEKTYKFRFVVISDKEPTFQLESLFFIKWKKETEIQDLSQIQIGIMPLADDQWAKGKCGFKALQYMALGIVPVISPIGVNKIIIQEHKNGFFASECEEWYSILESLIINKTQRVEIGSSARNRIIEKYSVSSQKDLFLSLFQ